MKEIRINASESYTIYLENGLLDRLDDLLDKNFMGRYLLLTDKNVDVLYADKVSEKLSKNNATVYKYVVEAGEVSKSFGVLEKLIDYMALVNLDSKDVLVALGGGVVGDLGGFAAGIYRRGIDYIQIPTSLLAQVDSSVGGKTAINLEEGKNLVGLIKQPLAVYCDPLTILTLTDEDFSSGMGEVVKYAVLFDRGLIEKLDKELSKDDNLEDVIATCIEMKKDLVEIDEFDKGQRHLLNLGHTVGHAIEKISSFKIKHGLAVALGIAIMAKASCKLGLLDENTKNKILDIILRQKLPIDTEFLPEDLFYALKKDKKIVKNNINEILIKNIGDCDIKNISFTLLDQILQMGIDI